MPQKLVYFPEPFEKVPLGTLIPLGGGVLRIWKHIKMLNLCLFILCLSRGLLGVKRSSKMILARMASTHPNMISVRAIWA